MQMKNIFLPDIMFSGIYDIDADFLKSRGIDTVILDIDNTLVTYGDPEPTEPVCRWIEGLRSAGLNIAVASNNKKERVELFCRKIDTFFTYDSGKPSGKCVRLCCEKFGTVPERCAVIGDQIFTDVLCARRAGAYAVLVTPLKYKENLFFKFKRLMEKPFIQAYKRKEKRAKRRKDKGK